MNYFTGNDVAYIGCLEDDRGGYSYYLTLFVKDWLCVCVFIVFIVLIWVGCEIPSQLEYKERIETYSTTVARINTVLIMYIAFKMVWLEQTKSAPNWSSLQATITSINNTIHLQYK
jgi:hypothetical protein